MAIHLVYIFLEKSSYEVFFVIFYLFLLFLSIFLPAFNYYDWFLERRVSSGNYDTTSRLVDVKHQFRHKMWASNKWIDNVSISSVHHLFFITTQHIIVVDLDDIEAPQARNNKGRTGEMCHGNLKLGK